MSSKVFLLLGLLLATGLLISSNVAARDLVQGTENENRDATTTKPQDKEMVEDSKKGGESEGINPEQGGRGGGGGGGGGGYGHHCYYGCCRRGYYGCIRCCRYPGQAVEPTEAKP